MGEGDVENNFFILKLFKRDFVFNIKKEIRRQQKTGGALEMIREQAEDKV